LINNLATIHRSRNLYCWTKTRWGMIPHSNSEFHLFWAGSQIEAKEDFRSHVHVQVHHLIQERELLASIENQGERFWRMSLGLEITLASARFHVMSWANVNLSHFTQRNSTSWPEARMNFISRRWLSIGRQHGYLLKRACHLSRIRFDPIPASLLQRSLSKPFRNRSSCVR
jgi:hypothetical protein